MPNPIPPVEHVTARLNDPNVHTLTIAETAVALSVSQNFAYAQSVLAAEDPGPDRWPVIRMGRKVLVPANWVRAQLRIDPTAQRTA